MSQDASGHPRLHDGEVAISDALVRDLLTEQFPDLARLALVRMPSSGTDNIIYRLGADLGLRLPRIHWAVQQVDRETQWLPRLSDHLPLSIPEPVAVGEPGGGYPHPWLLYRWLPGTDAVGLLPDEWMPLAVELGAFVKALHDLGPSGGPVSGRRGLPLGPLDGETRRAIGILADEIDVQRALTVWDEALAADPWDAHSVWVHGDFLPGNVLVNDGHLSGVIDWSAVGLGDPACDLMIGWSMATEARRAFFDAVDADDATIARARGWVVQGAVHFIPYYVKSLPTGVAAARRRLATALAARV